jgi:hypothetical protein
MPYRADSIERNGESSMASARVAAEAGPSRVERNTAPGGGRKGRRERGLQNQITEWKPARPNGSHATVVPRVAHALSRVPFAQKPGNGRSNGPGKTAQLDQQDFHQLRTCPVETSNHHLGFPADPIVLQLTDGPRLRRTPSLLLSYRPQRGGGPGNRHSSPIRLYLRCFVLER